MHIWHFSSFTIYISITLVGFQFYKSIFPCLHFVNSQYIFLTFDFYHSFLDFSILSKYSLFRHQFHITKIEPFCMHVFWLPFHPLSLFDFVSLLPHHFQHFLTKMWTLKKIHFDRPLSHVIIHNFPNPLNVQWIDHCFKVGDFLQFIDSMISFSHIQHCQVFHLPRSTYWLLIFQFQPSNPFIV